MRRHQDRAERFLLPQPHGAAARHLQAGQQRAGQRRAALQWACPAVGQELLQAGPVRQAAEQRSQPVQRVLHRPQRQRARLVAPVLVPRRIALQIGAHQRARSSARRERSISVWSSGAPRANTSWPSCGRAAQPGGGGADRVQLAQPGGEHLGRHARRPRRRRRRRAAAGGISARSARPPSPASRRPVPAGRAARPRSPPGTARPATGSRSSPDRPSARARGRAAGRAAPRTRPAAGRRLSAVSDADIAAADIVPSVSREQTGPNAQAGRVRAPARTGRSPEIRRGSRNTTSSTITMPARSSLRPAPRQVQRQQADERCGRRPAAGSAAG